MGAPQVRVQAPGGRLDVFWPGATSWTDLVAGCRLRDGSEHRSTGWTPVAGSTSRHAARCGPLAVEAELAMSDGRLRVAVDATLTEPADVVQVWLAGEPCVFGREVAWLLANGYQSWDAAGPLPAPGHTVESWWTVGLADTDGAGLAAAAVEARSCCTMFTLAAGVLQVVWCETARMGAPGSLVTGDAGAAWRSEAVVVDAGRDVQACLAALVTGRRPRVPVPVGWLSWYRFGPFVLRDEILANARMLATPEFERLGYRVVQVDDGWQETYGEWVVNTKFPGGLRTVADELAANGQVLGLWTAPFLVNAAADVAATAPDEWFLHDLETGERLIDDRHRVFGPLFVLDAAVPAVRDYLRTLYAGLREQGVRYFKVDFLYAGAYASTAAFRAALEAIRDGVGDAQLVVSGTPLLPVVGIADACRIGPDTATPLPDLTTGMCTPTVFGDEVLAVAANAAARSVLGGWFELDADVALVGGNLTMEQGRQLVTIAALSGGRFFASDDLPALPPERLALLSNSEVLALVGQGPAVPDWEPGADGLPPTHWRQEDVLAVFNWRPDAADVTVRAPGASAARDLWSRTDLDGFGDGTVLTIPGHGVRLLRTR